MALSTWLLFSAVVLAAVLTPGPAMLAIIAHALQRGARATMPVVLGNVAGVIVLIGVSIAGVAALVTAVPGALDALRWGGAAYLLWLGVRGLRGDAAGNAVGRGSGFVRGVLISFSNPKALLFFGAVLPQFVDPRRSALPQFGMMAGTNALLELLATSAAAFAAQALALRLITPTGARRVKRAGAAILIGAAALVALVPVHR